MGMEDVLAAVGPRLKHIRRQRACTLAALSKATGISVSTLSRLEAGQRKPSLELLLPIAHAHQVPLDELVGAPPVGDPRVRLRPVKHRDDCTVVPLTRQPGGPQAFKMVIGTARSTPEPRTHEGYEWLYVLAGELRLVLAERDMVLGAGEAAEFDTRLPHWFGSTGRGPVEVLSLFGPQGERMHVRARPVPEGAARRPGASCRPGD
ncbi:cupin domain-containing protein [Streptomyces triculaminicus]|uniref:Cupin domain-containing protein n=2 Tax=Streptomyces TaxID=1883 RepID=A0A939FMV5_9ACTN|nr:MULTISPECIES: XRE family transcriptional regulator [Streptomyces]MBO0654152.1 cupin domain-containing protein [Streptomyces triculaminicus]QSY48830.1 cupin domain-containing protein [Streptomyces griseocarneus]